VSISNERNDIKITHEIPQKQLEHLNTKKEETKIPDVPPITQYNSSNQNQGTAK
jgi:hypothetical protein